MIRSTLHDLANVLAGIRGILDLNEPGQALSARDRSRLDAVVEEGLTTLNRARHLAVGTVPEGLPEQPADWQRKLLDDLTPAGVLFRCAFSVELEGDPAPWPGEWLRGYLRAMVRQCLPYAECKGGTFHLRGRSEPEAWTVTLWPVSMMPEGLKIEDDGRPGEVSARWVAHVGSSLGITLAWRDRALHLRVPRP